MRARPILHGPSTVALVVAVIAIAVPAAAFGAQSPRMSPAGYAALKALGSGPCADVPRADQQAILLARACTLDTEEGRAATKLTICDTRKTKASARSCLLSAVSAIARDEKGDVRVDDAFGKLLAPGPCLAKLTVGRPANLRVAKAATNFVVALRGHDATVVAHDAAVLGSALKNEAQVEAGTTLHTLRVACRPGG